MTKKLFFFFAFLSVLSLISCKKSQVRPDEDSSIFSARKNLKATLPGGSMVSASPVYFQNGQYYSAFGGGIYFGSIFTYPTNLTASQSGYAWMPATNPPYGNNNLLYSYSRGPYFVLVYGTAVNGLAAAMKSTATDWTVWIGDEYLMSGPPPSLIPNIVRYGGSPTGIIEVVGQFVTDINSPTHVSIVGPDYSAPAWPEPQVLPGVINGYLGTVNYNNVEYELQGSDGIITHIRDITNGNFIDLTSFSGDYLVGRNGAFISVEFKINPNTADEISIGPVNVSR